MKTSEGELTDEEIERKIEEAKKLEIEFKAKKEKAMEKAEESVDEEDQTEENNEEEKTEIPEENKSPSYEQLHNDALFRAEIIFQLVQLNSILLKLVQRIEKEFGDENGEKQKD